MQTGGSHTTKVGNTESGSAIDNLFCGMIPWVRKGC